MKKMFKGRNVIKGNISGEALISKKPINILATFQKGAFENSEIIKSSDQNNPDIFNKDLTGKIICLPETIGSTSGGMTLHAICHMGKGPKAMLFSKPIDPIAAAGVCLAEVWSENKVITIDNYIEDAMIINIYEDGLVEVIS